MFKFSDFKHFYFDSIFEKNNLNQVSSFKIVVSVFYPTTRILYFLCLIIKIYFNYDFFTLPEIVGDNFISVSLLQQLDDNILC